MRVLDETGVDPACVCLEITETAVMDSVETAIGALRELESLGLRISVDDFGTGYSSLAYLQRLPIDELKIDRTFVGGLGTHTGDSAIASAVVSLAHALDLQVVAEGVETPVQLDELRRLGCENAQGYHFARPGPAAATEEMLAAAVEAVVCRCDRLGGGRGAAGGRPRSDDRGRR